MVNAVDKKELHQRRQLAYTIGQKLGYPKSEIAEALQKDSVATLNYLLQEQCKEELNGR